MTGLTALAAQSHNTPGPAATPVRHLRLPEVAQFLGTSLSGVYELIARGELTAVIVPGTGRTRKGAKRVREDDLIAFQDRIRAEAQRRTA